MHLCRSDVEDKTPLVSHDGAAVAYLELCQGKYSFPCGGMNALKSRFPSLNPDATTMQRTVKNYLK